MQCLQRFYLFMPLLFSVSLSLMPRHTRNPAERCVSPEVAGFSKVWLLGWVDAFSTVFQSYQDDNLAIMKYV